MMILVRNYGQLGNRLLLSAHLIAAAREYGVTLINPSFAEYARYFPSTANDLWCRYPVEPRCHIEQGRTRRPSELLRRATYKTIYLTGKALWYSQRLGCPVPMIRLGKDQPCDLQSEDFKRRVQSPLPLLLSGWEFRSAALLQKHADAIRGHFEILPEHRKAVTELMLRMRQNADFVVGVHIRHGDYATFENGKYFYSIPQYAAAMRRVREQLGSRRVAFLVCGNANLSQDQFADLDVHFGTGHLIEDMYAFAETDLLIGPPSTFTGWASFYGKTPIEFLETAEQPFDLTAITSKADRLAA